MATERLVIVVDERGARVVKRKLEDIGRGARNSEGAVRLLRRALGVFAGAATVRGVTNLVDEFQRLENRVKVALDGQGDYNETLKDLFEIANRTRAPIEELTTLYQRASLAAKELGASQDEMLRFVENVGLALAIQGGAAQQARGALIQLSQATGAGIVRAEEFNAILEGALPIAQAAARGIERTGGSVAALRREVIDGKITSEEFFRAILSQSEELEEQFGRTSVTIGQAFINLRNSLVQTIGGFSSATGASTAFTGVIQDLANFIRDSSEDLNTFGRALTNTLTPQDEMTAGAQLLASALVVVTNTFAVLTDLLVGNTIDTFRAAGKALGGLAAATVQAAKGNFSEASSILSESFGDSGDLMVGNLERTKDGLIGGATDIIDELVQIWSKGARLTADAQRMVFEPVDVGGDDDGPAKTTKTIAAETQKLIDSQVELLIGLQLERAALEEVAGTGRDYNDVLEDMITRSIAMQTGNEGLAEGIIFARSEVRRLKDEMDAYNETMAAGLRLTESLRTPNEVFADQLAEFRRLYDEGAISAQTFGRAVSQALDTLVSDSGLDEVQDGLKDFLTRARENAQDILGDALSDAFTGGLEKLPEVFSRVLLDLASQYFASEIFRALGSLGQNNSGGILKSIGGFFAGNFAQGGQFQVPGSGGADSVPVSMNLSPRETVTITPPGQQPAQQQAAPVVNLPAPQVVVVDDPNKVVQAMQGRKGEKAIIELVRKNRRTFKEILG